MENMQNFFNNNMDIVYFFYGFSFFVMGVAILIQTNIEKKSHFEITRIFWLLGVFGIFHGLHEWTDILLLFKENRIFVEFINQIIVVLSFIFLGGFAIEFYYLTNPEIDVKLTYKNFFVINFIFFGFILCILPPKTVNIISRYLLCLPSSVIIGKLVFKYCKQDKEKIEKFKIKKYFKAWGIASFFYSIWAGIFVNKADFFPSNLINKDIFFDFFNFPIEILRMSCAIIISWAIFNILRIFNNEYTKEIEVLLEEATQAKKDLIIKSKQLEAASKIKNEFIANITHDLKTPLNGILGFSEILLEESTGHLNDRQADYIKNIEISGKYLFKMILNILDISKLESNKRVDLNVNTFSFKEIVLQALNSVNSLILKKRLVITTNINLNNEFLSADAYKIRQAVDNLLSNAIKFTPLGGKINIKVKDEESMKENLKLKNILFVIQDTGIGIAKENQSKMFNDFIQIDPNVPGTGLGLSLTKKFIELHGGKIGVESIQGAGSIFSFSLPIISEEFENSYYSILQAVKAIKKDVVPIFFCKIENLEKLIDSDKAEYIQFIKKHLDQLFRTEKDYKIFYEDKKMFLLIVETDRVGVEIILKRIKENLKNPKNYSTNPEIVIEIAYVEKNNSENILIECVKKLTV